MDEGDEYHIETRPEERIYRVPHFRVSHGWVAATPENIEDDSPMVPAIYVEMKRGHEADEDSLLLMLPPQSTIRLCMGLLSEFDAAMVEQQLAGTGGEDDG